MPDNLEPRGSFEREEEVEPVKVRGVLERKRRRKKLFAVIVLSALAAALGVYVALLVRGAAHRVVKEALARDGGPQVGTAYGQPVRSKEFAAIGQRMSLVHLIIAHRLHIAASPVSEEQVWDRLILLHEARALGLEASPEEVDLLLQAFFTDSKGGFDRADFARFVQTLQGTEERDVRQAVAEDLLVGGPLTWARGMALWYQSSQPELWLRTQSKLSQALLGSIGVTDDEVKAYFLGLRRQYEAAYVVVRPDPFLAHVQPTTQADKQAWYEAHKRRSPEDSDDGVGYFIPARCRIAYFMAPLEEFRKTVTVSDDEARRYYDENPWASRSTTRPTGEPTTQSATRPRTSSPPAATMATATRSAERQPFEEVRESIFAALIDQKARRAAYNAVLAAGDRRLVRLDDGTPPSDSDLTEICRRYRLQYAAPSDLLTAREAAAFKPLNNARDHTGNTVDRILFGSTAWDWADLTDLDGNAYHAWRAATEKEHTIPYEEAKAAVARDLEAYRAYELAVAHANSLLEELKRAPAEAKDPLADLAARETPPLTVETTRSFTLAEARDAPARPGPQGTAEERQSVRLGLFGRRIEHDNLDMGGGAVVADPIGRTAYLLRVVKRTDPEIDEFRRQAEAYRREALQEKWQRSMKAWMAEVRKRADVKPAAGNGAPPAGPPIADYNQ